MASAPKKGDHVTWNTSQGTTEGTVIKTVTASTRVKGYTAKATKEDPQVVVRSDKTGKEAVHKPKSLNKTHD